MGTTSAVPAQGSPYSKIASLGGGHGLYQTLLAAKLLEPEQISAIVTVADDGGSSGRIRRELGLIPPGDLRMAIAALADDSEEGQLWARAVQHRFAGSGALTGHALGNLMIAGLANILGSTQQALAAVAKLTNSCGVVYPMADQPLDIEADVAGLDDDPRVVMAVRGQVAVATTPGEVRRVRLIPEHPEANVDALAAIAAADLVTIGPGSWFTSVLPHMLVPGIVDAINSTSATRVGILNLTSEAGETAGFSTERHIHMLRQHAPQLRLDYLLADPTTLPHRTERRHVEDAAASLGAQVVFKDLADCISLEAHSTRHNPKALAGALRILAPRTLK